MGGGRSNMGGVILGRWKMWEELDMMYREDVEGIICCSLVYGRCGRSYIR